MDGRAKEKKVAKEREDIEDDFVIVESPKGKNNSDDNFTLPWVQLHPIQFNKNAIPQIWFQVENKLYFSSVPTLSTLNHILEHYFIPDHSHTSSDSHHSKKLAIVACASYSEINTHVFDKVYKVREIEQRHWRHILFPISDYHDYVIHPEQLLWCVQQIEKAVQEEHVIVIHGGLKSIGPFNAVKEESVAALILILHQTIYRFDSLFPNEKSNKNLSFSDKLQKTISYFESKFKENSFLIKLNSELLTKNDWDQILSLKDNELLVRCNKIRSAAQALELHAVDPKKAHQLSPSIVINQWIESEPFKRLMIFLVHKVKKKNLTQQTAHNFISYFLNDFDKACNDFCFFYLNLDTFLKPKLKESKNNHDKSVIAKLFLELPNSKTLRGLAFTLFTQFNYYTQSPEHRFYPTPPLSETDYSLDEFYDAWELCQDQIESKINTNQKEIHFFLKNMKKIDLLNHYILSMNYYFSKLYFENNLTEELSNNHQQQLCDYGYPFGFALSFLNENIYLACVRVYLILFFHQQTEHQQAFHLQQQTFFLELLIEKSNKEKENPRALIRNVVLDFIESKKMIMQLRKKPITDLTILTIYSDLFKLICGIEKKKKNTAQINSNSQNEHKKKCFSPILEYLYCTAVRTMFDMTENAQSAPEIISYCFPLDIEVANQTQSQKPIFIPKKENDNLLRYPLIVAMNHAILENHQDSVVQQNDCLKEIVTYLTARVSFTPRTPRQVTNMFQPADPEKLSVLTSQDYLDHVLTCSNVKKAVNANQPSLTQTPTKQLGH